MPVKTYKGNWRWGNVERKTKKKLAQTVYGIWKKNGGKGDFGKFFKTGKANEAETVEEVFSFHMIPQSDAGQVLLLLDEIDGYVQNERYDRQKLEQYLYSKKQIDRNGMYFAMFVGDRCKAVMFLNKVPEKFTLVSEFYTVEHGYGKFLLIWVMSKAKNLWFAADPDRGESLLEYYRQFEMKEIRLDLSKWTNTPETVFYTAGSDEDEQRFVSWVKQFDLAV